jgi:hypothetical protein
VQRRKGSSPPTHGVRAHPPSGLGDAASAVRHQLSDILKQTWKDTGDQLTSNGKIGSLKDLIDQAGGGDN